MNLERYTQKAQQAVIEAQRLAEEHGHASVEPGHLLLALLRQPEGVVPAIATRIAGSPGMLVEEVQKELVGRPKMVGGGERPGLSLASADVLAAAERQAGTMKDDYVSTEHVLLALAAGPEAARLKAYGITPEAVLQALTGIRGSQRVNTATPRTPTRRWRSMRVT